MAVEEAALCIAISFCSRFTTCLSQRDYFIEIEFRLFTQFWGIKSVFYWLIRKDLSLLITVNVFSFSKH